MPVYLKTGRPTDSEKNMVQDAGFHFFSAQDLLEVLEDGKRRGVNNDLYDDFLLHVRRLAC